MRANWHFLIHVWQTDTPCRANWHNQDICSYNVLLTQISNYNLKIFLSVPFLAGAFFEFLTENFSYIACFGFLFSSLTLGDFLFLDLFSSCSTSICFHSGDDGSYLAWQSNWKFNLSSSQKLCVLTGQAELQHISSRGRACPWHSPSRPSRKLALSS